MKTTGSPGPQISDDLIALIVVAVFFGGPVLAMVAGAGGVLADWLVGRGVLTRTDVLLEFTDGAGLDGARCVVAVAVCVALLAWRVHVAQRRRGTVER